MKVAEFKKYLELKAPPAELSLPLAALWHDAQGDWESAHDLAQDDNSRESAWVHAYLHRKEGDISNAAYWYRQAGKPACSDSLDSEWESLVTAIN